MSTPSGPVNKTTPGNASTPHYLHFSSPIPPRSVQSPAALRAAQQTGKSPLQAPSTSAAMTAAATTGPQSHPSADSTLLSASGHLLRSSPAGALANFDSPGLMLHSLSSMGFAHDASGAGTRGVNTRSARGNDEERRRKLEAIVDTIKTSCPVRLSPEGLEIVGQRLAMDVVLDPPKQRRKDGSRDCYLAGQTIVIEVGFEKNEVKKLEFSMPNAPPSVSEHFPSASQTLLENLTLPKASSPLLRKLDKFSTNLERLANLDRLNISNGPHTFNCFEAIAGIHSSLRRLYEHEKQAALALIENQASRRDECAERLVMCKMSGRPKLNSRGIVGLGIDYWMHNRHTFHESDRSLGEDEMDIGSAPETSHLNGQDIFTLVIDCESAAPEEYLPARNSDAWISDQIEKQLDLPDATFGAHLDWLDPPPTYLSYSADTTDAMALDVHENKLPGIRFVAKLEPPLEMPLNVAANILAIVNSSQQADELHYYHTLALHTESGKPVGPDQDIVRSKLVAAPGGTENHITTLRCKPVVVGRLLKAIPFEHPKQLIQILPILRQWALVGSLWSGRIPGKEPTPKDGQSVREVDVQLDPSQLRFSVYFSPIQSFIVGSDRSKKTSQGLKALLDMPRQKKKKSQPKATDKPHHIIFDIGANGDVDVPAQNLAKPAHANGRNNDAYEDVVMALEPEEPESARSRRAAQALDILGDISLFVTWIERCSNTPA